MRARTFVFALVCGTATAALAQDSGYVRFPSPSSNACATACASDQMCASWSFGTAARSYGQNQTRPEGGGMCTFSASSTVRTSPGMVSGLPRRQTNNATVPMMSAPPNQGGQSYISQSNAPQQANQGNAASANASGWGIRPAPWLRSGEGDQQMPPPPPQAPTGMPQQLRQVPPIPAPTPSAEPRIEFDAQPPSPQYNAPQYTTPQVRATMPPASLPPTSLPPTSLPQSLPIPPPVQRPYVAPTPAYTPPPVQVAPVMPAPPPRTSAIEGDMLEAPNVEPTIALPTRPRAGAGVPKGRASATPRPPSAATAPAAAPAAARAGRRVARGTPRSPASSTPATTAPTAAAPPRQETASRPVTGRNAPRAPVLDPNDPESFRGADGMIDSAQMRRAQLNAARDQGVPAYSVQREWEAVAAERQRAEDAGEVRVDPLAGTVPVAPPPETRAQRRAREAEEAVVAAETARDAARANGDDPDQAAPVVEPRPARRGARGTPRPKPPRQTSQTQNNQAQDGTQVAQTAPPRRARTSRRTPPQALDREPRLSGGPG